MKAEFKTISESESMARMRAYIETNAATIGDPVERQAFINQMDRNVKATARTVVQRSI